MSAEDRIVAIGLLTERDLSVLGQGFKRAFPLQDPRGFDDLLRQIDEADRSAREATPSDKADAQ